MKIFFIIVMVASLLAISFFLGMKWEKYRILKSDTLELQIPLTLQSGGGLVELPEGTILYSYSSGPSLETFVVFINTKNLNTLKPFSFEKPFIMVPLDAYSE